LRLKDSVVLSDIAVADPYTATLILERVLEEGDRPARLLALSFLAALVDLYPSLAAQDRAEDLLSPWIVEADLTSADMARFAALRARRQRADA
jgi:hypothetical protein